MLSADLSHGIPCGGRHCPRAARQGRCRRSQPSPAGSGQKKRLRSRLRRNGRQLPASRPGSSYSPERRMAGWRAPNGVKTASAPAGWVAASGLYFGQQVQRAAGRRRIHRRDRDLQALMVCQMLPGHGGCCLGQMRWVSDLLGRRNHIGVHGRARNVGRQVQMELMIVRAGLHFHALHQACCSGPAGRWNQCRHHPPPSSCGVPGWVTRMPPTTTTARAARAPPVAR